MCFDAARDFAEFKTKLIHNQQTLMESVKFEDPNLEVPDTMMVEDENLEDFQDPAMQGFTLFEMVKEEVDNSFCEEEHLDPNIEVLQEAVEVKSEEEPIERVSGKRKEKKKLCSGE